MTTKDDGGPAFPVAENEFTTGMTLRQYAAIKLRVPDSGLDWLDAMILQSQRDAFAGQALAGISSGYFRALFAAGPDTEMMEIEPEHIALISGKIADAMLAARKGGAE